MRAISAVLALILIVAVSSCSGSNKGSVSQKPATPTPGSSPGTVAPTPTASSATTGTLKITVSGATSGTSDGHVTLSGCGPLGASNQGYHLFATTTLNGHTVDLRFELPQGYHGPGGYQFNTALTGRFDDQTAQLRWADVENATGPYGSGTVTMTTDQAGTFDVTMLSAAYKTGDPEPAPSQVHVVGSWSCG